MKLKRLLSFAAALLILAGCGTKEVENGPKKEITAYEEKIIKVGNSRQLDIACDVCNLEVFTKARNEIKVEIIKTLRSMDETQLLNEKMKDFKIQVFENNDSIVLKSVNNGNIKSTQGKSLTMKLYIPKNLRNINLKIDSGSIKILDDIRCDVNIKTNAANSEINKLMGKLTFISESGNLKVAGGKLRKGSKAVSVNGNMAIKADMEQNDAYCIETRNGNIDVQLPENLDISVECIGNVFQNDFTVAKNETTMKLSSGIGRISARKYLQ